MANGAFNRGSNNAGRKRDGSRLPGQSASEGNVGNVIPRPTTLASIRRAQSLMNILNDKQSGGNQFSRGTTKGGVRRNFSLMAQMSLAAPFSVQAVAEAQTFPGASVNGPIQFSSVNYDPNGMWSPPEKIICQSDGTYTCGYLVTIEPWVATLVINVKKNGATAGFDTFSAGETELTGSHSVALTVGDEVTLEVEDPTGPAVDLEVLSALFTVSKD
jgi:hypothetical protein